MYKAHQDVLAFHKKFFPDRVGKNPMVPADGMVEFRIKLMQEEFNEMIEGMREGNLIKIADGMADTIYTILGTAITYGIPVVQAWDEVHRSNMTKEINPDGNYTSGGKASKGKNYSPPDLKKVFVMDKIRRIAHKVVKDLNQYLDDFYRQAVKGGPYVNVMSKVKYSKAGEYNYFTMECKLSDGMDVGFRCATQDDISLEEGRCIAEHVKDMGYIKRLEYREFV